MNNRRTSLHASGVITADVTLKSAITVRVVSEKGEETRVDGDVMRSCDAIGCYYETVFERTQPDIDS